jgi:hypothetical protein
LLSLGAALGLATALAGCGGGSSSSNNSGGNSTATQSAVSGTITDINGAPIVGATVQIGTLSTTSTQSGTYIIPGVTVPAGQSAIVAAITASATVSGHSWTGSNNVQVLHGETVTSNAHVVLSDATNQATLTGTVRNTAGVALAGALVSVSAGLNTSSSGAVGFTNLASFQAYTNTSGQYTIPNLPVTYASAAVSYTVTASLSGYANSAPATVTFTAGATQTLNPTLTATSSSAKLPTVTNFDALTFTGPSVATRYVSAGDGYQAIKQYLLSLHGHGSYHAIQTGTVTWNKRVSRSTPAGSLIETDLFWNYVPLTNLYGYEIDRADGTASTFFNIATLHDPLADYFADLDANLTPDTNYYYSVTRLDTINYPKGNTSSESSPAPYLQVTPLGALNITAPVAGATVTTTPTLTWAAVNRAATYTVLVYNQFPTYQSNTQGVAPIVTQTVNAPTTSYTLTTALASGTYYWAVAASVSSTNTAIGSAFSVSPIGSFVVP